MFKFNDDELLLPLPISVKKENSIGESKLDLTKSNLIIEDVIECTTLSSSLENITSFQVSQLIKDVLIGMLLAYTLINLFYFRKAHLILYVAKEYLPELQLNKTLKNLNQIILKTFITAKQELDFNFTLNFITVNWACAVFFNRVGEIITHGITVWDLKYLFFVPLFAVAFIIRVSDESLDEDQHLV